MPNWKTHIEIGKKVNKVLKYEGDDYNLFLIANVLPDVNNSYFLTNVSAYVPHNITHLKNIKGITYLRFKEKYKTQIENKDPLFMGYLLHLYVDYYFNQDYYNRVSNKRGPKQPAVKLKEIKHHDFAVFNSKFKNNNIAIDDVDKIVTKIKDLEEVLIKNDDILAINKFLAEQEHDATNYIFYKEVELDLLLNKCVKSFIQEFSLNSKINN